MAFSSSFSLSSSQRLSQLCYSDLKWRPKRFEFVKPHRKFQLWIVKSVLNDRKFPSISDNGASEPDRIFLERLFTQAQRLEQQIGRYPRSPQGVELGANLGVLESDIQAALSALRKKEEHLQDAERRVLLESNAKNHATKVLQQREEELEAARVKHQKLEDELRLSNMDLASQATEISELKIRLKERDHEISTSQSALLAKEKEITKMKAELMTKCEEAAHAESELSSKAKLLDEANKIVERQEVELQQLQSAMEIKEKELDISRSMQKSESEKLKFAEENLQKQTMDWLLVQEELKKMAEKTSKHVQESNASLEEFGRVKKLLSDVRSELVSSQKALASAKQKLDGQEQLLTKQLAELEEQRGSVTSYMVSLRDAQVELETERVKLRVAEARNKELERDLSIEKELVSELSIELDKDRLSLKEAIQDMSAQKEELDRKNAEFEEAQILLQDKESELVEARMEIQHLKSEQASVQLILEERDLELSDANKMLKEVTQEVAQLKRISSDREEELSEAISSLKEKDEYVHTMQHELDTARVKFSEAEMVVERIVDLTKEVVLSFNDDGIYALAPPEQTNEKLASPLLESPPNSSKWQKKQLEAELQSVLESLRAKEMEALASQRALTIKDEELKMVLQKLDTREKEITELRGEIVHDKDDLRQLYALMQERIGEKSVGNLAIEKLELEAAQLEIEAATTALQKITEMSRELLNRAVSSIEADFDIHTNLCDDNTSGPKMNTMNDHECPKEIKCEVSRLLTLTEQLVRSAGLAGDAIQ